MDPLRAHTWAKGVAPLYVTDVLDSVPAAMIAAWSAMVAVTGNGWLKGTGVYT